MKTKEARKTRMTVDEMTRLAFIYAEQDRGTYADSWPDGTPERKEAFKLAKKFREYRLKRWGRTSLEAILGGCVNTPVKSSYEAKP